METNRPTGPDMPESDPSDNGGSTESTGARIGERVRHAREVAGARAERTVSSLGRSVEEAGHRIREKLPVEGRLSEGRIHETGEKLADRMESAGRYLQEADFDEIAQDITSVVRRYPMQSVLVGLGVGFLIGRLRER